MIPLINHDSRARSQWGRYNLPRLIAYETIINHDQPFIASRRWNFSSNSSYKSPKQRLIKLLVTRICSLPQQKAQKARVSEASLIMFKMQRYLAQSCLIGIITGWMELWMVMNGILMNKYHPLSSNLAGRCEISEKNQSASMRKSWKNIGGFLADHSWWPEGNLSG